jgi:hypothetical protein
MNNCGATWGDSDGVVYETREYTDWRGREHEVTKHVPFNIHEHYPNTRNAHYWMFDRIDGRGNGLVIEK